MKHLKKLSILLIIALCATALAGIYACAEKTTDDDITNNGNDYSADDDDTNWSGSDYVVYLYLPDGTPVEGVKIEICADKCTNDTTNEDGRAYIDFDEKPSTTPFMHFTGTWSNELMALVDYEGPEGYTLPEGSVETTYGDTQYNHVWYLEQKVTKLYFVAE